MGNNGKLALISHENKRGSRIVLPVKTSEFTFKRFGITEPAQGAQVMGEITGTAGAGFLDIGSRSSAQSASQATFLSAPIKAALFP